MYMHTSLHALLGISRPPSLVDDAFGTIIEYLLFLTWGEKKKMRTGHVAHRLAVRRGIPNFRGMLCEGYNRC